MVRLFCLWTTVFLVPNARFGVCEVVVEGKRGPLRPVMVPSIHDSPLHVVCFGVLGYGG